MTLERLPARDTLARLRDNKHRIYPSEKRGAERLMPFARPAVKAGFRFGPEAKIFATGSCFARNVEKSLRFIGANVVSSPTDIPVPSGATQVFQLYNKYTVHSILNEFRWALGGAPVDHAATLIADAQGNYYDMQVAASSDITGDRATMAAFRAAYNASFARAAEADVVILTLGLVECWYDLETGLYLNMAPPKPLLDAHPDRFEFHLLDHDDVYRALCDIHALLTEGRADPPRLLVTVSPVGLAATFREMDVLVANSYSKSVQRAAVEAFVLSHDASYFPSYEYVTLTDRKFAWGNKDFRHVRQETVDRIMADVLEAYVGPSPEQRLLHVRGHAQAHFDADDHDTVAALIEPYLAEMGDEPELLWLLARSERARGNWEQSVDVCRRLIALEPEGLLKSAGRTALNTLAMIVKKGDDSAAPQLAEMADWYRAQFPEDAEFLKKFA